MNLLENHVSKFRDELAKKIRLCAECGKEFIRRQQIQRFCSSVCRDRWHAKNPADKQRRAEWAKAKYWEGK